MMTVNGNICSRNLVMREKCFETACLMFYLINGLIKKKGGWLFKNTKLAKITMLLMDNIERKEVCGGPKLILATRSIKSSPDVFLP